MVSLAAVLHGWPGYAYTVMQSCDPTTNTFSNCHGSHTIRKSAKPHLGMTSQPCVSGVSSPNRSNSYHYTIRATARHFRSFSGGLIKLISKTLGFFQTQKPIFRIKHQILPYHVRTLRCNMMSSSAPGYRFHVSRSWRPGYMHVRTPCILIVAAKNRNTYHQHVLVLCYATTAGSPLRIRNTLLILADDRNTARS
ncbi:hypothetical protein GGS24DRAFT_279547 [Hypoxylon argillaceum]|nr:hypothetical protein GGS24DRAFT_279547 [Hypoxylon argillaceum]